MFIPTHAHTHGRPHTHTQPRHTHCVVHCLAGSPGLCLCRLAHTHVAHTPPRAIAYLGPGRSSSVSSAAQRVGPSLPLPLPAPPASVTSEGDAVSPWVPVLASGWFYSKAVSFPTFLGGSLGWKISCRRAWKHTPVPYAQGPLRGNVAEPDLSPRSCLPFPKPSRCPHTPTHTLYHTLQTPHHTTHTH